jgi:hypothetical protein
MAGKGRGYGAIAAGFALVLVGLGLFVYAVWSTGTIPLNDYTYGAIGLAGVGIALGAVGLDRGIEVRG